MAILDELVTQIENPDLRARIAAEVESWRNRKNLVLCLKSICRNARLCGISLLKKAVRLR